GKKCPSFNPCFVTGMHQRAEEADLIIVNHHLFFADLALKQDDFGSILPEYSAVVFDEAHEMEDVASEYFGRQISNFRFEELARRSFELRQELSFLFESNEKNFVYWYERRNKGVFLTATPINVSQILREKLFEQFDTVILTSATLTVGGRFDYIRQRLGIDHARERTLPPEFDYPKQAMLY